MNINSLTDIPKLLWLALMGVGFVWFWPVGVAVLVYLVVSGKLGQRVNLNFGPTGGSFWSSGNKAFDAHREDVLTRLRAEQTAFDDFLTGLAAAKDKAEFDQFMNSRKQG